MITYEQRETAFEQATKTQLALYDTYDAGQLLYEISRNHQVHDHMSFTIAVGDVILGLVPQEKLPDLLIERLQITRPEAMRVTADVLDFLAPLTGGVSKQAVPKPIASTPTSQAITEQKILETEIAQTEANLHVVEPMRTMAHDMEVAKQPEVIHQATDQADLIPDGPGNSQKNEHATWGTTQS